MRGGMALAVPFFCCICLGGLDINTLFKRERAHQTMKCVHSIDNAHVLYYYKYSNKRENDHMQNERSFYNG